MKLLETAQRVFRNTLYHLVRNLGYSVAAVLVTALAFYSISYFAAAAYKYNQALEDLKNKPQLTVFFRDETTEEEILNLQKSLEARGEVKRVGYISKKEALALYQEQNQDKPELLEFVTADILPASLEVSTTQIEFQESLARELSNNSRVENVIFHGDVVQKLIKLTNTAKIEGLVWAASLSVISVLTILVVVGVSISTFGEEIEIMRLVGAGSGFIRWPFVLQGAIYGILAAALSALFLYFMPYLKSSLVGEANMLFLPGVSVFPIPDWLQLWLWTGTTVGGAVLGSLASTVATWRQLRT